MFAHVCMTYGRAALITCTKPEQHVCDMQIRSVDKRTLLLWGAEDRVLDPKLLSKYEADITDTATQVFDDCGHWVHLEKPDGCVDAILDFCELRVKEQADELLSAHAPSV